MSGQVGRVGGSRPVHATQETQNSQSSQKNGNIDMQHKSDEYIETKNYIESRMEICARDKDLKEVFNKVEYIIRQDGAVQFKFKSDVNIEQFKKAFGFEDGYFRSYLRNRHDQGIKNGSVHPIHTNGHKNDQEEIIDYNLGGIGTKITYTDGYSRTKGFRGGWINRSKIVDHPDYTQMSLGPNDNEKLPVFGKDFFNYK